MNVQPRHRNLHQGPATGPSLAPAKRSGVFRRVRKHPLITAALVAALAVGVGYFVQIRAGGSSGTPIVEPAVRGDVEEVVTALGSLTPLKSVDVGAQVSGQLDTLHVQIGDTVKPAPGCQTAFSVKRWRASVRVGFS